MVTITRINNARCDFEYQFGQRYTFRNLPVSWVEETVLRTAKCSVHKLLRQISADVDAGTYLEGQPRVNAAAIIAYRTAKMAGWSTDEFKDRIANLEPVFLQLLPKPTAKTYQKLSQLVFDIILYAATPSNTIEL